MAVTSDRIPATGEVKIGLFHKFMLGLMVLAILTVMGVNWYTAPKTYTVDDKHWTCLETEPVGIGAECTHLAKKRFSLKAQ